MYRILLNFAGAINLSIGSLIFLIVMILEGSIDSIFILLPFIIIFATGGVFLYAGNKPDLNKKFDKFVLISAIVNVFLCNMLSTVLGILGYSMLRNSPKKEYETIMKEKKVLTPEEKETRRLRNILSLGVGLVVLAGIIFATSTWETLSGSIKTIILVFVAILFYLVSALAEKKLKLKVSGMMYYALSNVLIVVSLLSAGYFEVFGNWFSLSGDGNNLFFSVIWLVVGVLSLLAYFKYGVKNILYLIYYSILNVLCFCILSIGDFFDIAFTIISLIISFGAVFKFKNEFMELFDKFCKVLLPIFMVGLFINIICGGTSIVFSLVCFLACSIAGYYLALVEKNEFFEIFAPLFSLVNAVAICLDTNVSSKVILLQISAIAVGIYAIGYYKRENRILYDVSAVICNFAWLYAVADSIDIGYYYLAVIVSLIMLISSIIVSFDKNSDKLHFEKIVEPVKILVLAYSLYILLNSFEFALDISFGVVMAGIFLIMYLAKKDLFKFVYFIICCFVTLWVFILNLGRFAPVEFISSTVISLVLLITVCFSKEYKYVNFKEAIYTFLLFAIFSVFKGFAGAYEEFNLICILGVIVSYTVAYLMVSKNYIMRLITILFMFMPYYWALNNLTDLYISDNNFSLVRNVGYIFSSIPCFLMIVIYTKGFLKSVSLNVVKVIEIVALSIWYFGVLSESSAEVGLFIGIVALVSILIGYKSEKYIAFYYTGIVFTVLNLMIQLRELWSIIPIWAYILVAGLILIGLVTYKEYGKVNAKSKEVIPDIIEPGSSEVKKAVVNDREVLIGSIIYGFILLFRFIIMF